MEKIRSIIRYHVTTDLSERQIARALNVSRAVVGKYLRAFTASGLSWQEVDQMADSALMKQLDGVKKEQKSSRFRQLSEKFPYFLAELRRKGVTLQLLWEEYLHDCPNGYQYTQFCYHFQMWRESDVRMHIEHKAGDKMFVDYAGTKLTVTDRVSGKQQEVEVYVAILGASELTYVEASKSQQENDWIRSNERALRYFHGSPAALVPDNLKSAVTKADRYEPGINCIFDEFAKYYNVVIVPARVRKARDKALVENAVRIIYQRVYAPLRNQTFYSLEELNEAIWQLLEKHNNTNFQRMDISRRGLFERIERNALRPLPVQPFALKTIQVATVRYNYHVELREDLHYYSVPWHLYRKEPKREVKLVYDERVVAIYFDNIRVGQHLRDRKRNGYTTDPAHMPPEHRMYGEWNAKRFLRWARSLGTEVEEVISGVLERVAYPQQAYNTCLGILNLHKRYGTTKLNKACKRAVSFGMYSYKRIENILKQGLEEQQQGELDFEQKQLPLHENVRGSDYYH
jgi:transposase